MTLFVAALTGFVFFLFQRDYLVLQLPWAHTTISNPLEKNQYTKQKICIFYPKGTTTLFEEIEITSAPQDRQELLNLVVKKWLIKNIAEKNIPELVTLDNGALNEQENHALLSFNSSLFKSDISTEQKWKLIQALMRTFVSAEINLLSITFLKNGSVMDDAHLDLSEPVSCDITQGD